MQPRKLSVFVCTTLRWLPELTKELTFSRDPLLVQYGPFVEHRKVFVSSLNLASQDSQSRRYET